MSKTLVVLIDKEVTLQLQYKRAAFDDDRTRGTRPYYVSEGVNFLSRIDQK